MDLAAVRSSILDDLASTPPAHHAPNPIKTWWRDRPWAVAVGTAALIVALFVPIAWLGRSGDDPTGTGPAAGDPLTTTSVVPSVDLPTPPPEPTPAEAAPPAPTATTEIPTFEMTFVVGDAIAGRLIWVTPTFYEGLRGNLTDSGAVFDYGMHRAGTEQGFADPDNSVATIDGLAPGELPQDPAVPWDLLINRYSDETLWQEMAGTGVEPTAVVPSHPAATRAWASGEARLEVTENGVPVVIGRPGHDLFEVTDFTERTVRAGEIGNNTDLGFEYAVFLSATAAAEQLPVLADGIVTFSDYVAGAEAAAHCAGVEPRFDGSSGLFEFPQDPATVECVERHVAAIAAVWRVDSQWLDDDDFTTI